MSINALKKTGKKLQAGFTLIELMIVVAIIAILAAVAIPNFLRARAKANFTATVEQLKNIASGMEQEISEVGDLGVAPVASADEICHHILSGFDKAAECTGQVATRFDEIGDNLAVEVLDDFTYNIKGEAREKSQCKICVTEVAVRPKTYDPGGACLAYDCVR